MLSAAEQNAIDNLNARNKWGVSCLELENLIYEHQAARDADDTHKMELIEYRLTNINYHSEVRLLEEGKYQEALAECWA
jgi:hypothetical protein